jgi:hypothetical protein
VIAGFKEHDPSNIAETAEPPLLTDAVEKLDWLNLIFLSQFCWRSSFGLFDRFLW